MHYALAARFNNFQLLQHCPKIYYITAPVPFCVLLAQMLTGVLLLSTKS